MATHTHTHTYHMCVDPASQHLRLADPIHAITGRVQSGCQALPNMRGREA